MGKSKEADPSQPPLTMSDIGRRGAKAVKEKYLSEFFTRRGLAGARVQIEAGKDFSEMGKKGAKAQQEKHPNIRHEMGKKGGTALRDKKKETDPDYWRRISELGKEAQRKKRQQKATS